MYLTRSRNMHHSFVEPIVKVLLGWTLIAGSITMNFLPVDIQARLTALSVNVAMIDFTLIDFITQQVLRVIQAVICVGGFYLTWRAYREKKDKKE